jgi:preprotein translocase subunit YajC
MNFLPLFNILADATAPTEGAGGLAGGLGGMGAFLPWILIFAIFYFIMIRPQQRKEKERQKMISELRAGQRVMFAGGMVGNVVETREHTFLIEIAPGVKIEVARGAVSRVLADGESAKDA